MCRGREREGLGESERLGAMAIGKIITKSNQQDSWTWTQILNGFLDSQKVYVLSE